MMKSQGPAVTCSPPRKKKPWRTDNNIAKINNKIQHLIQSNASSSDEVLFKLKYKVPNKSDKKAVEREHLTIFKRTCCGLDVVNPCQECGIQKLKCVDCSLENNDNKWISFKRYEKERVQNADGTQETKNTRVLTTVKATYKQFFDSLYEFLPKYLRHYWVSKWDKFHRHLFFDHFPETTLAMHTDFSATYATTGQDEATCHQARTCIQQVFVVSYVIIDSQGRRTQQNESLHFWGENDNNSCPSNYVFHNTCVKYIIQKYQEKFGNKFTKLAVFSDGCAEQYKSSQMTFIRGETNIQEIIHTYAPTAQFKCCCDSAGSDTKSFMRRAEQNDQVRATNAWEVFAYLHDNMPKPNLSQNRLYQFKITDRNNYYVLRELDTTDPIREWMQKPDHNVVFLRESVGAKKGQKLIEIRGIYQIRVSNMMEQQSIMHRNITCACVACIRSKYAFCQTNSTWTEKNLAEILTRQALINRARATV